MRLLPSQRKALRAVENGAAIVAWAGGMRSGKTIGLCVALLAMVMSRPAGSQFLVVGRTFGAVTRNILPVLKGLAAHWGMTAKHHRGTDAPYLLVNGRTLWLFGAGSPAVEDAIAGLTASGGLIDEAARIPPAVFWQAWGRLSMPNSQLLVSLNKTSPFGWFKTDVWDRLGEFGGVGIENTIDENIYITAATRAAYRQRFAGHYAKRLIDNEWAAAGGVVYSEYQVIDALPRIPSVPVVLAMDWGPAGVTAGNYFAKRHDGAYDIIGEYHHDGRRQGRLTDAAHADAVRRQGYQIEGVILDPSAIPLRDALKAAGYRVKSGRNDVDAGIIATDAAFRAGRLRVARNCVNLLGELDSYIWNAKEDRPVKKDDHHCDAVRYAAMDLTPIRAASQPSPTRGF